MWFVTGAHHLPACVKQGINRLVLSQTCQQLQCISLGDCGQKPNELFLRLDPLLQGVERCSQALSRTLIGVGDIVALVVAVGTPLARGTSALEHSKSVSHDSGRRSGYIVTITLGFRLSALIACHTACSASEASGRTVISLTSNDSQWTSSTLPSRSSHARTLHGGSHGDMENEHRVKWLDEAWRGVESTKGYDP